MFYKFSKTQPILYIIILARLGRESRYSEPWKTFTVNHDDELMASQCALCIYYVMELRHAF